MKFALTKCPGVSRRWTRVWRRHAIISSVPLLSIEANWCGSRCGLTTGRMAFSASLSRHFAFMELRAAGWLRSEGQAVLGNWMMIDVLHRDGMWDWMVRLWEEWKEHWSSLHGTGFQESSNDPVRHWGFAWFAPAELVGDIPFSGRDRGGALQR